MPDNIRPAVGSKWQNSTGVILQVRGSARMARTNEDAIICKTDSPAGEILIVYAMGDWSRAQLTEIKFG